MRVGIVPDVKADNMFRCEVCGQDFSRKATLKRHVGEVHLKATSSLPVCTVCSKVFCNQRNLLRHLNLHKNENPPPIRQAEPLPSIPTDNSDDVGRETENQGSERDEVVFSLSDSSSVDRITQDSQTASPPARHCVSILFPSLAGDTDKFADNEECCSVLERHGFALVLLASCLKLAIGELGHLRIIACEPLCAPLLSECAKLLGLTQDWASIVPSMCHFSTLAELKSAMNVSTFVQSPFSVHSLFIIGHGDFERIRVNYGGRRAMLKLGAIVDLIHRCNPHQIHIMTCKSQKLACSVQRKCVSRGICLSSSWCSYGEDDVTTVPFDFGSPLDMATDWLSFPLDEDFDTAAHTHITASTHT